MTRPINSRGFTLLELLIVVSILSATAYVTLNTLNDDSNQRQHDHSLARLEIIRDAVIGPDTTADLRGRAHAGYVADNGLLPVQLTDLYNLPAGFQLHGNKTPRFDSDPDALTGINDGGGTQLTGSAFLLLKGYRGSGYIRRPAGSQDYLDGYGNGWQSWASSSSFSVATLGLDQRLDVDVDSSGFIEDDELINLYDRDYSVQMVASDWQIDLAGWQVSVANRSGNDLLVATGHCLRLSLLIYRNNGSSDSWDPRWQRLTSDCIGSTAADPARTCLDGDGDGQVMVDALTEPCSSTTTVTFPVAGGGDGNFQPPTEIPQGEHLLLLVADTDNSDAHNDSSEQLDARNLSTRVRFYAGLARPDIELSIR